MLEWCINYDAQVSKIVMLLYRYFFTLTMTVLTDSFVQKNIKQINILTHAQLCTVITEIRILVCELVKVRLRDKIRGSYKSKMLLLVLVGLFIYSETEK